MRKKRFMNNKGVGKYQGILYFVSGDVIIVDKDPQPSLLKA